MHLHCDSASVPRRKVSRLSPASGPAPPSLAVEIVVAMEERIFTATDSMHACLRWCFFSILKRHQLTADSLVGSCRKILGCCQIRPLQLRLGSPDGWASSLNAVCLGVISRCVSQDATAMASVIPLPSIITSPRCSDTCWHWTLFPLEC